MTASLEGGEWSAVHPGRTLHPGKTRYPFCRRLGGPQGWSGRAENIVPSGTRYRTVQPVVIRYTCRTFYKRKIIKILQTIKLTRVTYMCVCVCVCVCVYICTFSPYRTVNHLGYKTNQLLLYREIINTWKPVLNYVKVYVEILRVKHLAYSFSKHVTKMRI